MDEREAIERAQEFLDEVYGKASDYLASLAAKHSAPKSKVEPQVMLDDLAAFTEEKIKEQTGNDDFKSHFRNAPLETFGPRDIAFLEHLWNMLPAKYRSGGVEETPTNTDILDQLKNFGKDLGE